MKEVIRKFLPRKDKTHSILAGSLKGRYIFTNWHDYPAAILGTTEKSLVNWFEANVNAGETWLDIGAHYGYTAIALSELVGSEGHVFAFEPMLTSAGCIQHTRKLNNLAQLRIVPAALGNQDALDVEILPTTRGMVDSTIHETTSDWFEQFYVTSLDWIWEKLGNGLPIHGIKIDVQGMEMETLRGMKQMLELYKPKLIVEVHDGVDRKEFEKLIDELGYVNNYDLIDTDQPIDSEYELMSNLSYVFMPKRIESVLETKVKKAEAPVFV